MTKQFKIAHINQQGQDIIIIPLDASGIGALSAAEQESTRAGLQFFASDAGLRGIVCLVWQSGSIFHFIAPAPWHPFFRSIDMAFVEMNKNRTLDCTYSDIP